MERVKFRKKKKTYHPPFERKRKQYNFIHTVYSYNKRISRIRFILQILQKESKFSEFEQQFYQKDSNNV